MNTPTTPSPASVAVAQNQYTPTLPTGGWEGFYNQLTSAGNIPNLQVTSFSPDNINAVFRGVYIKMSDIQAQLQRQETVSGVTYDICTVYTDVLNIDTQINWALANSALVIYARVIETAAGSGLTINMDFSGSNSATSLMVFSSSISGTILVNANGKAYTNITNDECVSGLGINYNTSTKAPATSTLQLYNGIPVGQISDDQNFYLSNSFICAALCNDTAAEIAVDILVWVNQWAGASFTYKHQEFVQLFFQSSSLSMFIKSSLTAQNNGGHYVPELNGSVYEALIATINTELTNNYNNYLTIFTATQVDQNFIDVAQTMQGIYQNDVANYTSLLAQAQQEYQSALDAENKANENFQLQQIQVVTQGNNLNDVGIPEFKEKEIFKAIIDIGKALVTFGIGIAGMATGNEETAPVAAEGAIEAVQAAKAASATVDAMKNLKKLMDLLNKLYTLANSIYTAASGIKNPNNPIDPATAGAQGLNAYDSINSTAAWDVYQIQLDQSMTPLVTAGIQYADDYKAALDCLVVYGKALAAAKIATIKACQKVVSAQVELAYSQANTQSIVNLVSALKTNQGEMTQLQKLFYQKYVNTKLTLYTLLKNYEATYFYWALTPYPYPVNFIDFNGLSANNNQLINLQLAEYAALANFNGRLPQNMPSIKATIDMSTIVRNSQNTVLTWNLSTANSAFAQLARVRFDRVRVWLDGANLYPANPPGAGVLCKFHVSTSGNYADTDMNGNPQLFCTGRYNFEFEYTVNTRQQVSSYDWVFAENTNLIATVNLDGEIPTNLQNDYIQPTPFSEWTLSFAADSGINVNNITSITMDFEGSAISLVKGAK